MSLSKKHFEAIAAAFQWHVDTHKDNEVLRIVIRAIAHDIATMCQRENSAFDRARFMRACGFEE
jgi:hypothetical protein